MMKLLSSLGAVSVCISGILALLIAGAVPNSCFLENICSEKQILPIIFYYLIGQLKSFEAYVVNSLRIFRSLIFHIHFLG